MAPLTSTDQSRAIGALSGYVLFTTLPPVFVALRIWARRIKNVPLEANDYLIMIAMVFTIGYNVDVIIDTTRGGAAQHITRLSLAELLVDAKTSLVATVMWPCANTFVKLSILDLYSKIFPNQAMHRAAWVIRVATISYGVSAVLAALLICRPIAYNWNKTIDGTCGNISAYYLPTGIVNLFIDVSIVVLPMPQLWGLQMRLSRKVALTIIFGLGFLICIISIFRIVAIRNLDYTDFSYSILLDALWTALEPTLGVINAYLPVLQSVATKLAGSSLFRYIKRTTPSKGSLAKPLRPIGFSRAARTDDSESKKFIRLQGDSFPLAEVYGNRNELNSTVTGNSIGSGTNSEHEHGDLDPFQIRVKRGWDVESAPTSMNLNNVAR